MSLTPSVIWAPRAKYRLLTCHAAFRLRERTKHKQREHFKNVHPLPQNNINKCFTWVRVPPKIYLHFVRRTTQPQTLYVCFLIGELCAGDIDRNVLPTFGRPPSPESTCWQPNQRDFSKYHRFCLWALCDTRLTTTAINVLLDLCWTRH